MRIQIFKIRIQADRDTDSDMDFEKDAEMDTDMFLKPGYGHGYPHMDEYFFWIRISAYGCRYGCDRHPHRN